MAAEAINAGASDADVFVYMGEEGAEVPRDVVRARVHPSVTRIPEGAFRYREKLEDVELCEGLSEIGQAAFYSCCSLKGIRVPSSVIMIRSQAFSGCVKMREVELCEGLLEVGDSAFRGCPLNCITVPSTVERIGESSFYGTSIRSLRLPDGAESIGDFAFFGGKFTTFRIPPLISTLKMGLFSKSSGIFSVEIPESVVVFSRGWVFAQCYNLRNIAIPPNVEFEDSNYGTSFNCCLDLQKLIGEPGECALNTCASDMQIMDVLKRRFNGLPIHKMLYYQSYQPVNVDQLNRAIDSRYNENGRALRRKLDPTGKQQDCLGMNPLHVLACSSVQNMELYQVLIDTYPENLVAKDKWGATPLLYAVWGNALDQIVQLLVESYKSMFPDHEFDWTEMVTTLGRANAPVNVIQNLLDIQNKHFSEQKVTDMDNILESLTERGTDDHPSAASDDTFQYLVKCSSVQNRLNAIGVKNWRDDITKRLGDLTPSICRSDWLSDIRSKLAHYESLIEAMAILELTLWKKKLNDSSCNENSTRRDKKLKMSESGFRRQCRVNCGADLVIENVLPYLLPRSADEGRDRSHDTEEGNDEEEEQSGDEDY